MKRRFRTYADIRGQLTECVECMAASPWTLFSDQLADWRRTHRCAS